MRRSRRIASAFILAGIDPVRIYVGGSRLCAIACRHQSEPSNDAERALVAQHPKEWANLTPDQRERVLENYRRWQSMPPEERQRVQRNFETFRNLPPEERKRVLEGLRKWRAASAGAAR